MGLEGIVVAVRTMWSFQTFFAGFKLLVCKGAEVSAPFLYVYKCLAQRYLNQVLFVTEGKKVYLKKKYTELGL